MEPGEDQGELTPIPLEYAMNLKNGHPPGKSGFLAAAMPLAVLTFATLLAFVNAWPASLALDDKAFAGPGRAPELDSLYYMFTQEVWGWIGSGFGPAPHGPSHHPGASTAHGDDDRPRAAAQ